MGVVRERQTRLGTVYERYDGDGTLIQRSGTVGFIKKSTEKGLTYFMITNLNGVLIYDANYYLNSLLAEANYKNRERAYTALKLFYSFFQLLHKEDFRENLTEANVKQLKRFLDGGKSQGVLWDIDFETRRTQDTIKNYMGVYRDFYKIVYGIKENPLFNKSNIGSYRRSGATSANRISAERYTINGMGRTHNSTVPMYIKPYQYERIMEVVEESYGLREKVIIQLMYRFGLRLGEVLGLTFEDIEPGDYGKPIIVIRNRVSDKPYQSAKGCFKVSQLDDYNKSFYKKYNVGFQIVVIDEEMKQMIEEYIDESRDEFLLSKSSKKKENLRIKAIADRVGTMPLTNNENQYIFLSQQHYTPLTQSGWNYTLRKIMKTAGVTLDKGVKEHNLSHRFRHAFAMQKKKEGFEIMQLAEALRHSSTESCKAYYNPDEEDKAELLIKAQTTLKERYNFE